MLLTIRISSNFRFHTMQAFSHNRHFLMINHDPAGKSKHMTDSKQGKIKYEPRTSRKMKNRTWPTANQFADLDQTCELRPARWSRWHQLILLRRREYFTSRFVFISAVICSKKTTTFQNCIPWVKGQSDESAMPSLTFVETGMKVGCLWRRNVTRWWRQLLAKVKETSRKV